MKRGIIDIVNPRRGNIDINKIYRGIFLIWERITGLFLLDLYPNAAVAYSLRQIKSGITNVVRVRRSSDNTESDFTATQLINGTLETWVGAGNDGFVTVWYDQSGGGRNLINTVTSTQPQIVSNGVYLDDIVFTGTQELNLATDYYVFGGSDQMSFFEMISIVSNAAGFVRLQNYGGSLASSFLESTTLGGTGRWYNPGIANQVRSNVYLLFSKNVNHYSTNFGGTQDDGVQQVIRIWRNKNDLTNTLNINRDQWLNGNFRGLGNSVGTNLVKRHEFIIYPNNNASNFQNILDNMIDYYPVLLLDMMSVGRGIALQATAAYSLRRLQVATTSAVRVRRSSDNVEENFSPEEILDGTLETWVGSGNNGFVTIWYNQGSTVGRDLTQTTAASQPQIVENGSVIFSGGKPFIRFDGTNQFFNSTAIVSAYINNNLFTNFNVLRVNNITTNNNDSWLNNALWSDVNGYVGIHFRNTPNRILAYNFDTTDDRVLTDINLNQNYFSFFQHKNNEISLIINDGAEAKTASNNTGLLTGAIQVGRSSNGSLFNGLVTEMVWTKTDEISNLDVIRNNINKYYDIYREEDYLLDIYSGAAVAYSLRRLRKDINDVVRVRRSSDNSERNFTPNEITNGTLLNWVGSGNDGFVSSWFDQSGNNRNGNQTVAVRQFKIVDNGSLILDPLTGKPSSYANGTNTQAIVLSSTVSSTDKITHILVHRRESVSPSVDYWIHGGASDNHLYQGLFRPSIQGYIAVGQLNDTTIILTLIRNGSGNANDVLFSWRNGVDTKSIPTGTVTSNNISLSGIGRNGISNIKGYFMEFISYTDEKISDRVGIETEINNYYNIY